MKKENILVTGAAGFIGSHLADYLMEKGYNVFSIDNFCAGTNNLPEGVKNYNIDITSQGLYTAIQEIKPKYIFHLAAVSRTPWAVNNPWEAYQTNVMGTANVLEAAKRFGVEKVIIASSNIVYAAQTPYKSSKLALEMVARDYNDLYDLPTVCLRFSNVYGSLRQNDDNVLAALAKSKRTTGKIRITGDGEQSRDFTHVFDICEALYTAAMSDVRGNEIDICTGKMWTLNEVAKFYDCPIEYIPERKGDIKILNMTGPEKAKELLGFTATRQLNDHIAVYTDN